MKNKIFLFTVLAAFIYSCTNDKGPVADVVVVDECSFTEIIEPIISTSCAISGCHDAGSLNGDFSSYENIKLYADDGKLNNRLLILQDMPVAPVDPLSEAQKSAFDCWLKKGAPKSGSTSNTIPGCETTISFLNDVAPIISTNCAVSSCHNAGSPYGDYTSFAKIKEDADNGKISYQVIELEAMPRSPIFPLSEDEKTLIDCWIKQGAKDN